MKNLLLIIFLITSYVSFSQSPCPVKGSKNVGNSYRGVSYNHIDSLKNRDSLVSVPTPISVYSFYKDDSISLSDDQSISVTGYIIKVKLGGPETCNCGSTNKNDDDYHIEIVDTVIGNGLPTLQHEPLICEVNRFARCIDYATLQKLVSNKKNGIIRVRITGDVFHDIEHMQNSVDENPSGTDFWRQTDIEIHPVIVIEVLDVNGNVIQTYNEKGEN